jgi:hypothetical protein
MNEEAAAEILRVVNAMSELFQSTTSARRSMPDMQTSRTLRPTRPPAARRR